MERHKLPQQEQSALERLRQPFAIYQFVDKRVVTLMLSDGFCKLFGYNKEDFMDSDFTVVLPDSKNLYQQIYVAN